MSSRKALIKALFSGSAETLTLTDGTATNTLTVNLSDPPVTGMVVAVKTTGGAGHDGVATSVQVLPCKIDGSWLATNTGDPVIDAIAAETAAGLVKYTYGVFATSNVAQGQYAAIAACQFEVTNGDINKDVTVEIEVHVIYGV